MAKSDRLLRVLHLLRSLPAPVTAQRLSDALEISERTLYRDIDALRAAGAQIDGTAGLGYTMIEDVALPPQTLTRLEVEALGVGLSEVQLRGDPSLAEAAKDAMAKITASLTEARQRDILHAVSQVYRFTRPPSSEIDITTLREACWSETEVEISYTDLKGHKTYRRIRPLAVMYYDRSTILLAHCLLRDDYRQFHFTGIERIEVTATSFRPHRVRLLKDFAENLRIRMEDMGEELYHPLPPGV